MPDLVAFVAPLGTLDAQQWAGLGVTWIVASAVTLAVFFSGAMWGRR